MRPIDREVTVGVLCGGPSAEREVSLRSGKAVHEGLLSLGCRAVLLELSPDVEIIPDQIKRAKVGIAFVVLHGPFGEDGTIQGLLEQMGIPHTGSNAESSRYAMDKISSRRRCLAARLPVPQWIEVQPINAVTRGKTLRFPLFVKPSAQGSSYGMSLVESLKQLPRAVEEAAQFGDRILLEEYLPGPELTVGILQDQPLPVIQIVPKRPFYDLVAKYTPGMCEYRVPAPLPIRTTRLVQHLALSAHRVLGCRSFSRVDMILVPKRGPVLLEINTIPGMTATSLLPKAAAAAGIDFPELCRRMLESANADKPPAPVSEKSSRALTGASGSVEEAKIND